MNNIHTTFLHDIQKKEIQALAAACCQAEPVTLSAPLEDGLEYFLGYEDGELVSMVFLFFPEESVCECGAYTLPGKRQKGYFSQLLHEALAFVDDYEKKRQLEVSFCFLSDGNSPAAAAVLKALEAEYWYSEYGMSLELPVSSVPKTSALEQETSRPETTDLKTDGLKTTDSMTAPSPLQVAETEENLYIASLDGQPIGACMTIPNGDSVYFYGFEIKRACRRKGYGQKFLEAMMVRLSVNYRQITLQVSSLNTAAMALYTKTGFRITETLSYYLY